MELMEKIRIAREYGKHLLGKPITIKYDKEKVSENIQKYLQTWEDFLNDNFEKMYDQMMLHGEWVIVGTKDGSFELV